MLSPLEIPSLLKPHGPMAQGKALDGLSDGKSVQQDGIQRWSRAPPFLLRKGKGLHIDGDGCH